MERYSLEIKPALHPDVRHAIEDTLVKLGFEVSGYGTGKDERDKSFSFINFFQGMNRYLRRK